MDTRRIRSTETGSHAKWIKFGARILRFPHYLIVAVTSILINIPVMNTIWRERREMEFLTVEQLRDIGLSPEDARLETSRSFFDIPGNRKKRLFNGSRPPYWRTF